MTDTLSNVCLLFIGMKLLLSSDTNMRNFLSTVNRNYGISHKFHDNDKLRSKQISKISIFFNFNCPMISSDTFLDHHIYQQAHIFDHIQDDSSFQIIALNYKQESAYI